jgi:SAM-dependent methyltransferase
VGAGTVQHMATNGWLQLLEDNPGHSAWYVERFRTMAAEGRDLHGEARLVDALAPREARILDAGCGPGRVGGRLAELGHDVVGVDLDRALIAAAEEDHPGPAWHVRDLSTVDPAAEGWAGTFDVVVSAGNVMPFLDPATRRRVLANLAACLAPSGRLVVGFGAGRGYEFEDFFADAIAVGLREDLRLATWDLRPFEPSADFVVAVLSSAVRSSGD